MERGQLPKCMNPTIRLADRILALIADSGVHPAEAQVALKVVTEVLPTITTVMAEKFRAALVGPL